MLRELSAIQYATGQYRRAFKNADKSCEVAERQEAKYEFAQSDLLRSKLAVRLKMPGADQQLQSATTEMERYDQLMQQSGNAV